jgi:hypothetical protein
MVICVEVKQGKWCEVEIIEKLGRGKTRNICIRESVAFICPSSGEGG